MKKLTSLGCLLALVFAGASAFATPWFDNVVSATLDDKWDNTTGWSWTEEIGSVPAHGVLTNWNAQTPLKYTPSSLATTGKDTAVSTQVKFSVMDYEDLTGAGAVDISDAKAGLTVAKPETGDAAYYGIVNGAWVALEGASPTEDDYVDVKVELCKKNGTTYVNYTIGTDPAVPLTYEGATDLRVKGESVSATIASVEYLGQCNIATLAGAQWSNPCKLTLTIPDNAYVYVNGADDPLEAVGDVYSIDVARHGSAYFTLAAKSGYSLAGSVIEPLTDIDDDDDVDLTTNVTVTKIPSKEDVGGADVPRQITVDNTVIATRLSNGAEEGPLGYLYTKQSNGQLGWVNYSLGIADNATIEPTNAVQSSEAKIAVNFGVEVAPDATVTYQVGDSTGLSAPEIALGADNNTKIVDVKMILTDEGGDSHEVASVKIGVMDTGKDVTNVPTGKKTFDIVAVPWDSMDGSAVTVATLLNTGALKEEDMLYVWNETISKYDTYKLTDGVWDPQLRTTRSSTTGVQDSYAPAPEERTIAKGVAVWLEHSTESSIIFAGKATDIDKVPTALVDAGGATEATWSLIANPSINPFVFKNIEGAAKGDAIVIEDAANPREYKYDGSNWTYDVTTFTTKTVKARRGGETTIEVASTETIVVSNEVIPAGIGFWYVRAAGADALTLRFENNITK